MEGVSEGKKSREWTQRQGVCMEWGRGGAVWQFRENSKWYLQDDPFVKYFKEHGKNERIFLSQSWAMT